MARKSRIILHGKHGANEQLRDAVEAVRGDGHHVEVCVTWEAGDDVGLPAILSDHPASASRVSAIQRDAKRLGCSTKPADPSRWKAFQQSLPQDEPAPAARE